MQNGPARRRGQDKEEKCPEKDKEWMKIKRQVYDCPIETFPPKNSADGKASRPVMNVVHATRLQR
jgi:hypothetical protein